jgi:2'-5' RNA ligase
MESMPFMQQCPTRQSEGVPLRTFIALRPESSQRNALGLLAKSFCRGTKARAVRAENVHLTLAFIGELDCCMALELKDALGSASFRPVPVWPLTHLGRFGAVLWCAGEPLPQIAQNAASVRALLQALNIPHDRKRFAAHITLARNYSLPLPVLNGKLPALHFSRPLLMVSERDKDGVLRYRCL